MLDLDWRDCEWTHSHRERPSELDLLLGDAFKAKERLAWEATEGFEDLVRTLVGADFDLVRRVSHGHTTVESAK